MLKFFTLKAYCSIVDSDSNYSAPYRVEVGSLWVRQENLCIHTAGPHGLPWGVGTDDGRGGGGRHILDAPAGANGTNPGDPLTVRVEPGVPIPS